jgi:RNA polymerase subunit RPABC4/transcription elongation factor Spt4
MIGEIRDSETAQISFRASITGHLVLSTVHTNDAPSAITRLIDVGLQPFMVASSLLAVMSMRLVRTICPKCREPHPLPAEHARALGLSVSGDEPMLVYRGVGCAHCRNTGYYGRTGLFEILEVNDDLRELINQGAPDSTIRIAAIDLGMRTLAEDGIEKVLMGLTTLEEVNRVVYVAEENRRVCPYCSTVLAGEFDYCPSCGHFVGDSCVQCHRRLNSHWSYCPFCGTTNRAHRLESRFGPPAAARIEGKLPEFRPAEAEEPRRAGEGRSAGSETPALEARPASPAAEAAALDEARRLAASATVAAPGPRGAEPRGD